MNSGLDDDDDGDVLFHFKETMIVVSLCFSLTLDPWRYNTRFWLLILFIKQICYWTKAKIRWLWF